jgi:septal ring factor EnvC (AmiA/AmiB activator)
MGVFGPLSDSYMSLTSKNYRVIPVEGVNGADGTHYDHNDVVPGHMLARDDTGIAYLADTVGFIKATRDDVFIRRDDESNAEVAERNSELLQEITDLTTKLGLRDKTIADLRTEIASKQEKVDKFGIVDAALREATKEIDKLKEENKVLQGEKQKLLDKLTAVPASVPSGDKPK